LIYFILSTFFFTGSVLLRSWITQSPLVEAR